MLKIVFQTTPSCINRVHQARRASSFAVDEILRYVRSPAAKENPEQVIDILKSGLARGHGVQAGRLYLALAEVALERSQWADAAGHAQAAAMSGSVDSASEAQDIILAYDIQQEANEIAVSASLTHGMDDDALALAEQGVETAHSIPDQANFLTQRWRGLAKSTARLGLAQLARYHCNAVGHAQAAQRSMDEVLRLAENEDPAVGPLHGEEPDMAALPMMPRDMHIPAALHRYGAWAFTQGKLVQANRYLQKAAMAAEASRVQAQEKKEVPLTELPVQEVMLAAFSGHVQTEMARAKDQQGWKQAEMHLESALERAEAISGPDHPRIIPTLIHLGEVYAHTQRVTLAEGLYRKASKMLYRNPTAGAAFIPRQQPPAVHSSLAVLLAWRYAQLLTALPKRDSEARQLQEQAQELFAAGGPAWEGPIEQNYGDIQSLKGKGSRPVGIFVDNALRRAISCRRRLVGDIDEER